MPDKIKFFTADYRDKYVYINGNKFFIGSFVVDFLNQYEENVYMMKYFDVRIEKLEDRHEYGLHYSRSRGKS